MKIAWVVVGLAWLTVGVGSAQEPLAPDQSCGSGMQIRPAAPGTSLSNPDPEPGARSLPINLATALGLANTRPIDIELAAERVRAAAAGLELARAAWLPTVTVGAAYDRHDGETQGSNGVLESNSHGSLMVGAGTGIGSAASTYSFNSILFGHLVARQVLQARQADLQAATNDTMLAVTNVYFTVEQARGELAGARDATQRTVELLRRVQKLADGLVPPLEITRTEGELARRQEAESVAMERWQVASADLLRVLRLDATAQVEPMEPPDLQIVLIDVNQAADDLVVMGLTHRPELAAYQAQIQATLLQVRQEKLRPFMPILWVRGFSTGASGTLAAGAFGGGPNGSLDNFGGRADFDVQMLWQFDNLGFGNRAKIHQRQSDNRAANLELIRVKDRIAAEVAQAYAQARQAAHRAEVAEREVKLAVESYDKNLVGLGQTRRAGEMVLTIVRPQEVQAAVQFLAQAYTNYYQAVADSNRAQFRLYRAIGQPAQQLGANPLPACCQPYPVPNPSPDGCNTTH